MPENEGWIIMLWNDAETVTILGIQVYAFGLYVSAGTLASLGVILWQCARKGLRKGTAPLLMFLSMALGLLCSRLGFCLLNQELGDLMPPASWIQISGGGWSLMGLIGGVLLAAWLTAKILREKTGDLLDIVSMALPLVIAFERAGERLIPDFDISRALETPWLQNSFLSVQDDYGSYLATYAVASFCAILLFVFLLIRAGRAERKSGDGCIAFLLCTGAGAVILESLRYDRFLSITFVGLQQILAAVLLAAGIVAAVCRGSASLGKLKWMTVLFLVLTVGIVIGLEFALDRTTMNKLLIYACMLATVSTPTVLAFRLIRPEGRA